MSHKNYPFCDPTIEIDSAFVDQTSDSGKDVITLFSKTTVYEVSADSGHHNEVAFKYKASQHLVQWADKTVVAPITSVYYLDPAKKVIKLENREKQMTWLLWSHNKTVFNHTKQTYDLKLHNFEGFTQYTYDIKYPNVQITKITYNITDNNNAQNAQLDGNTLINLVNKTATDIFNKTGLANTTVVDIFDRTVTGLFNGLVKRAVNEPATDTTIKPTTSQTELNTQSTNSTANESSLPSAGFVLGQSIYLFSRNTVCNINIGSAIGECVNRQSIGLWVGCVEDYTMQYIVFGIVVGSILVGIAFVIYGKCRKPKPKPHNNNTGPDGINPVNKPLNAYTD
ncbi:unnamed protein product [Medioppia subpectinata]|uniref:Uncharacterized protein n=1 Tax=Medioppia subpectinata TaxID=1979941 RepID=A0A7R9Q273_9ACAR|nr:unnamed protein product [Medioppia subpectinata]CAG2109827.1 unnamed protein product [Medioppia subpectinata]